MILRAASAAFLAILAAAFWGGEADAQRRPRAPVANAARPGDADWRAPDPEFTLVIETNKGQIIVELEPRMAPQTVERIRILTRQGFYDGRTFFRVIEGFMDQTGDPLETGEGSSALPDLPAEFIQRRGPDFPMVTLDNPLGKDAGFVGSLPVLSEPAALGTLMADGRVPAWGMFCPGVVGLARAEAPDSGNSQFFLMRNAYPSLNRRYTAFGRAITGLDVIRSIKVGEPVAEPRDRMVRVRVLADLPAAERPVIRIVDPASAWFRTYVERTRSRVGPGFTMCDLDLPVDVRSPGDATGASR